MNPIIGPNKAIAAGVTGSASILLIYVLSLFGIAMPAEVAEALIALVATLATWITPHSTTA